MYKNVVKVTFAKGAGLQEPLLKIGRTFYIGL